jgi:Protein of unknown function (DUF4199)
MKQNILKYGTMAGITLIGYFLLFYCYDKSAVLGKTVQLSSYLIYAFFMFLAAKSVVNLDFKPVLRTAFGVFIVTNLFYYTYDYVLFNVVDKSLAEVQKTMMLDYFTANTKTIQETKDMTDSINNGNFHDFNGLSFAFAKGAIGGFILAVIVSYLVKKSNEMAEKGF